MKINDRWTATHDCHGWGLRDSKGAKTWHGTLRQIADKILDVEAKECADAQEIKDLLEIAGKNVEEFLQHTLNDQADS